jgi:protoporphyrinogen oxidase
LVQLTWQSAPRYLFKLTSHAGTAIIIGAGPAGLTAASELLARTGIRPIVLEMSEYMGGIARTINYKGNRLDIGGHRFFSKSDRVMEWWLKLLPLQVLNDASSAQITYRRRQRAVTSPSAGPDPEREDRVMLLRNRLSRVLFAGRFFDYPLTLSADTVRKLGLFRTLSIGLSYLRSAAFQIHPEKSLEDFFINRFGRQLYQTFFRTYTEKIWGVPCAEISAQWGTQRIKGLSLYRALVNIVTSPKKRETSLIESFLYPKFGPGQMWEEVAGCVKAGGGEILTGWTVDRIEHQSQGRIAAIWAIEAQTGERRRFAGDFFFSTMPVKDLIAALEPAAPAAIREIANGLIYRDFIIVGLLCRSLSVREKLDGGRIRDNWIYIQEPGVQVGRLQIFNNWSPWMVADPDTVWVGLEYFCRESDELWKKRDSELTQLARDELCALQFTAPEDVLDSTVIRIPKAYPAYFGPSYERFGEISAFTDGFENLFLIGRNGMHRYNNQDHSMLAAMMAVDNIVNGVRSRRNLWDLNTEMEYHEEK